MEKQIYLRITLADVDNQTQKVVSLKEALRQLGIERSKLIGQQKTEENQIKKLTAENQKLLTAIDKDKTKTKEYSQNITENSQKITESRTKIKELGTQIEQLSIKQMQAGKAVTAASAQMRVLDKTYGTAAGSIARLRAETSLMIQKANQMSVTNAKSRVIRDQLTASIQKNQMQIRNFDRAVSGSRTLVGEYSMGIGQAFQKISMAISGVMMAYMAFDRIIKVGWNNFKKWEQGIVNVQTLLFGGMDVTLEGRMTQLMKTYGLEIDELTKAFFSSVSAGLSVEQSQEMITQAIILSKAGVTDLATATDGMTSVMNAYRLSIDEAAQVASSFFVAQKYGKMTVEDLAKVVGNIAPIANVAGASYQEVATMMAMMTKNGLNARMAATAIRAAMLSMIKPTATAKKAFDELGITWGATGVREQGMVTILHKIADAYDKNADVLVRLTPNIRALIGLGVMNKKAMEDFDVMLKDVNEDYGEGGFLMKAYAMQMDTAAEKAKVFKANIRLAGMELSHRLHPAQSLVKKGLFELSEWFLKNADAIFKFIHIIGIATGALLLHRLTMMIINSVKVASIAITNGLTAAQVMENSTIKANTVITKIAIALKKAYAWAATNLTSATKIATVAQKAWNTAMTSNPIGLIITGVAALISILTLLPKKISAVSKVKQEMNDIDLEVNKNTLVQIRQVEKLVNIIKDSKSSYLDVKSAKEQLSEIDKVRLSNINKETLANGEARKSLDLWIISIKEEARVKAINAKMDEIAAKRLDVEAGKGVDPKFFGRVWNSIKALGNANVATFYDAKTAINNTTDALAELNQEEELYLAQLNTSSTAVNDQVELALNWETRLQELQKARAELESNTVKGIKERMAAEIEEYDLEASNIETEVTDDQMRFEMLDELEETHLLKMEEMEEELRNASKGTTKALKDDAKSATDAYKTLTESIIESLESTGAKEIVKTEVEYTSKKEEAAGIDNVVLKQKALELAAGEHAKAIMEIYNKEDFTSVIASQLTEVQTVYTTAVSAIREEFGKTEAGYAKELDALEEFAKGTENIFSGFKISQLIEEDRIKQQGEFEKMRSDENKIFDNRLKEYSLFSVNMETLTADQLTALEILNEEHNKKLLDIYDKELEDKIVKAEEAYKTETIARNAIFQEELLALGDNEAAKIKLKEKFALEELNRQREYITNTISMLQEQLTPALALTEGIVGITLSEEEKAALTKRINELRAELAKLGVSITELDKGTGKDIFGQTQDDWNNLKKNMVGISESGDILFGTFETVKESIDTFIDAEDITAKIEAIGAAATSIMSGYDGIRTQLENNAIAESEQRAAQQTLIIENEYDRQKASLDSQLAKKTITEEVYNQKVEALDNKTASRKKKLEDDIDKKKQEIEFKQARRDKINAIFSILINTAVGVVKAFPNIILMALLAVIGAASLAMVAATPLPKHAFGKRPGKQQGKGMVIPGNDAWDSDNYLARISSKEVVLNARSMTDSDVLTLTGTPREIASQINSYKGYGVKFAYGGTMAVNSSKPGSTIDRELVKEIVEETVDGILGIPVYVLESNITKAQRLVKVVKTAGDL